MMLPPLLLLPPPLLLLLPPLLLLHFKHLHRIAFTIQNS
jgi:hypothetical protein